MTNPPTKEQLQAIIDAPHPETMPGAHLTDAMRAQLAFAQIDRFKVLATLALQSLDREEVTVKPLEWREHHGAHADCVIGTYHIRHDGDEPEEWSWKLNTNRRYFCVSLEDAKFAAQADYEARILSALSPQPETAKEVGETEVVAEGWMARASQFERYAFVKGRNRPSFVAEAAVYEAYPLYAHPAPQSPPAPVVDEGMWEVEAYDADDNFAFGASGSLEDVRREIAHYAAVYNEPLRFERIQRSTVTFAALEGGS